MSSTNSKSNGADTASTPDVVIGMNELEGIARIGLWNIWVERRGFADAAGATAAEDPATRNYLEARNIEPEAFEQVVGAIGGDAQRDFEAGFMFGFEVRASQIAAESNGDGEEGD